jgi:hypothetical protein
MANKMLINVTAVYRRQSDQSDRTLVVCPADSDGAYRVARDTLRQRFPTSGPTSPGIRTPLSNDTGLCLSPYHDIDCVYGCSLPEGYA